MSVGTTPGLRRALAAPLRLARALASSADSLLGPEDRLEFERQRFAVRVGLLLWPLVLILAFGQQAVEPALVAAVAAGGSAAVIGYLMRRHPGVILRYQLAARLIDVVLIWIGLTTTQLFTGQPLGDQLYLLPVISATAGHGRRGAYVVATAASLAIIAARTRLVVDGTLALNVLVVIDAIGQVLLLFLAGVMLHALMRTSARVVERREAGLRQALADRNAELEALRQSEQQEAQNALRESEERHRLISELVTDFAFGFRVLPDRTLACEWVTEAMSRMTGFTLDELMEYGGWAAIIHADDMETVRDWWIGLVAGVAGAAEFRIITREGDTRTLRGQARPLLDPATGEVTRIIGAAHDITERKLREVALERQARHDALTDLPNRLMLQDELVASMQHAAVAEQQVALILLDLDRFKEVNDTLGHQVGDVLLKDVAQRLRENVRTGDTVARLGGDEFAIVLPTADTHHAQRVARKLQSALEEPFTTEGARFEIGASFGIAVFPEDGTTVERLLRRADVAMYAAKRTGVGCVVYRPSLEQAA